MKKEKLAIVKFYLAFVFILAALAAVIFIYAPGIVKIPICDVEENESEIVVEELEDGSKLVRNVKEGISVVAPEGWGVQYGASDHWALRISKAGELQPDVPTMLSDGIIIFVIVFDNDEQLNIEEWIIKEDRTGYEAAKFQSFDAFNKVLNFADIDREKEDFPPLEYGVEVSYLVSENNKIYEIYCVSIGEKYEIYSKECEDILLNNFELH